MTIIITYPDRTERIDNIDKADFDENDLELQWGWPFEYKTILTTNIVKVEILPT